MSDFVLRVILSDTDIRKIKLSSKPNSVNELNEMLKFNMSLSHEFVLLYEDKDFNNEYCTLSSMENIEPFGTVRIMEVSSTCSEIDQNVVESVDLCTSSNNMRKSDGNWPHEFIIPTFDHDVELILSNAIAAYNDSRKTVILARSCKGAILQTLARTMFDIKAYPSEYECGTVAEALVRKFPCVRESGSQSGFDGWKNSLQYKMGNYRTEIRKAGGAEVSINGGKRSRYQQHLPGPHNAIKKPRRAIFCQTYHLMMEERVYMI